MTYEVFASSQTCEIVSFITASQGPWYDVMRLGIAIQDSILRSLYYFEVRIGVFVLQEGHLIFMFSDRQ
jgi:hypothetical protein